jgi:hypothetical protein
MKKFSSDWNMGESVEKSYRDDYSNPNPNLIEPFLKDCYNADATCDGNCDHCSYGFTRRCGSTFNWDFAYLSTFSATTTATRVLG